jgi:hypothetical protein
LTADDGGDDGGTDECSDFTTQDECEASDCDWDEEYGYCYNDGPPDCVLDCSGLEDFQSQTEVCEFVVDIYGDSCLDDCDEGTMQN